MNEFLKGLDLDTETIDTIMAEHGKRLNGLRESNEKLKAQLNDANSELKTYKDMDIDGIKKSNETLTNENKDLNAQLKMVDCGAKKEFSKFVRTEVMSKVDDKTDFETALESYKKENPQYFGETVVRKVQSSPNLNGGENKGTTTSDIMNNLLRGSVGNE